MKIRLIAALCMGITFSAKGQFDNAGSGHAMHFNGSTDYIDLGNIYDDLTLPLTISAWVFLDPSNNQLAPIFATQDNADIYNGVQLFVWQNGVIFEYGDGQGAGNPAFRRGKIATFSNPSLLGRWIHICGVMNSAFDIQLYINGIDIGGSSSGDSFLPMDSNFPGDVAKIGTYFTNGNYYWLQGSIDEVRVWNRGLTAAEVREGMCKKLLGNEPGLIGYWTFNEISGNTIFDKSLNGFDGQLVGNPTRQFSGAPIGDQSGYQIGPPAVAFLLTDGDFWIRVENVLGNPGGVHLYIVDDAPSQQGGLDSSQVNKPCLGVFLATLDGNGTFDAEVTFSLNIRCQVYQRFDNSVPNWYLSVHPIRQVNKRAEFIVYKSTRINLDLGPDTSECVFSPRELRPTSDNPNYRFSWQDGSSFSTFSPPDFGTYWVTVTSPDNCVFASDTIRISQLTEDLSGTPNVITPNGDTRNEFFEVPSSPDSKISLLVLNRWGKEVFRSEDYHNDWDGGDLTPGTYFVKVSGACADYKTWLTLIR